jgi:tetratricopeptide (TPR) repeat protein
MARPENYGNLDIASSERVLNLIANAYFELRRYNEAIAVLWSAPSLKRNPYLLVNLALFYRELGSRYEAVEYSRAAYRLDQDCPLITAVYVRLEYEAENPTERVMKLERWRNLLENATRNFDKYYGVYLGTGSSDKDSMDNQAWRTLLFLVTTEAHFLIRAGDDGSLQKARDLLQEGEKIAPFDPWLRFEIGQYFRLLAERRRNERFGIIRSKFMKFKARWHLRSAYRMGRPGMLMAQAVNSLEDVTVREKYGARGAIREYLVERPRAAWSVGPVRGPFWKIHAYLAALNR